MSTKLEEARAILSIHLRGVGANEEHMIAAIERLIDAKIVEAFHAFNVGVTEAIDEVSQKNDKAIGS